MQQELAKFGAAIEVAGKVNQDLASIIVCLNKDFAEVQKILRSADFESVSFESMEGTVAELIVEHNQRLAQVREPLSRLPRDPLQREARSDRKRP